MHKRAQSYSSVIIFTILIMVSLAMFFVNPKVVLQNDFKLEANETNYKEISLANNEEIANHIQRWVELMPGIAQRQKRWG
jgi:hypothetical protein